MWLQDKIPALEGEIQRANSVAQNLLDEYVRWGRKIRHGDRQHISYGEAIDFVNFRMETAASCLDLISRGRVADALGLSRTLLENYLLFMLMCRGDKFFRVVDLTDKTNGEFKKVLAEQQAQLEVDRAAGKTNCVEVRKHPKRRRVLMYVYDGLRTDDGQLVPLTDYFFQFEAFRPEVMRLDPADYFDYYEPDVELAEALKQHRAEANSKYRFFLGYDALVQCLELNGLLDRSAQLRLEAHYTFLGKYVHPTSNAMRELHYRSNWHAGEPAIGMDSEYTQAATLLATVYVAYMTAGYLDEVTGLLERGTALGYFREAGTTELRGLIDGVPRELPYLWFLFNEAPLHDKFEWAGNHATDEELERVGGYANLPSADIKFNQDIYPNFERGLVGWENRRVGHYQPPFGS